MSERVEWLAYEFNVYPATGVTWGEAPGVFIFAGRTTENQWQAFYVGETDSFRRRVPGHEQWKPAARLGATHIHARVVKQTPAREGIVRALIQAFQPPLNIETPAP